MTQPAASSSSDLPAAADLLTAEVLALFTAAEQELLATLAGLGDTADSVTLLIAMRRAAVRRARLLHQQIPTVVARVTSRAARMGAADADSELRDAGVRPPPTPPRATPPARGGRPAPHRVDLLRDLPPARRAEAVDLASRLMATLPRFARFADDAYRAAVVGQLQPVFAGTGTTQLAQQAAWRALTERGVTGFVDRSGRKWNLASYVEMATRTAITRTYNAAHLERLVASGITQVSVPSTGHPCPLCRPWEGMVLNIEGPSPTIAEAEAAGLHHPNCRHTWVPYIPGRTRLPRPKPWTDVDQRKYNATQQLRALERRVRALRRAEVGAGNPLDARRARVARLAAQKQIREHVDRHGLVRRPRREQLDLGNGRPSSDSGGGRPPAPPKPPTGGGGGEPPDPPDDDRAAWKARQDALPVDFHGDIIEPHEVRFVERFLALGHRLDWIPRDNPSDGAPGRRPTNDFRWLDNQLLVCELKATSPRFEAVRSRISKAVYKAGLQGVVKENFVIDLGDAELTPQLAGQLARYNADRREQHIARMWVMSAAGQRLDQIVLE